MEEKLIIMPKYLYVFRQRFEQGLRDEPLISRPFFLSVDFSNPKAFNEFWNAVFREVRAI